MTAIPEAKASPATQSKGLSADSVMAILSNSLKIDFFMPVCLGQFARQTISTKGGVRAGKQHPFGGSVQILVLARPHGP